MKTQLPKINVLTLGCSKNTVDSEVLLGQVRANNFVIAKRASQADVLIINTCGFIESAKEESVNTILEGVRMKQKGTLKKLIVMGCLSERYRDDLQKEIPDVDAYFGTNDLKAILKELGGEYKTDLLGERLLTTPAHFAYLKISEGCDNPCSFCSIPLMRGGHKTTPMEDLILEAKNLRKHGTKELILIGQDLTYYGLDLYGERRLAELLMRLSDVGFEWIRLLYAYPAKFPTDILPVMRERENIVKYLDMPVQHISDEILKSMRRGITRRKTTELISQIKAEVPNIRLRTTFIIGYPNETEERFQEVLEFMNEVKFDRLGCFPYSHEENTSAFELPDLISYDTKKRRCADVMALQEQISYDKNQHLIGSVQRVLIDRIDSGEAFGRTAFDTPEVDNEVIITGAVGKTFNPKTLKVGNFYDVEITDAEAFDLFGIIKP
jgi:ribosomal protein S12 methylthiotransferase